MNLRRRFSVQARSTERNEAGERLPQYTHKFYIWAEPPREGATTLSRDVGLEFTEDTLRMRTRYRTDIEVGDRLVGGLDTLTVRSAHDVDGTQHWLQLVATRQPAPGT